MSCFFILQVGIMVEICRNPVNLDNLLNEGIAFTIDRFRRKLKHCPIGQQPVMIGRRAPRYNTLDKVMTRLERVMKVMEAMENIVVNVH